MITPARVTKDLVRAQGLSLVVFWGAMYVVFLVIGMIVNLASGLEHSAWIAARWWPQYMVSAMGILLTTHYMRMYIAHGVTRRVFTRGGIGYGLVVSVVFGLATQIGFIIERGLLNSVGVTQFPDSDDLVASPLRMLTSATEFTAMFAAYFFGGWLIGSAFYRRGTVWGLAALVPAALPAIAIEMTLWDVGPIARLGEQLQVGDSQSPAVVAVAVAMVAALMLVNKTQLRDTPIASK